MVGVENSHRTFHTFLVQPVGSFNVVQLDEITRELACTCMGGRMIQAERLANLLNRALVEQGKPAQPYPTACRVDARLTAVANAERMPGPYVRSNRPSRAY